MRKLIIASAALALPVLIIGCEKESSTTTAPPPATPAGSTATPSTPSVGDRTRDTAGGLAGQATGAAGEAASGAVSGQLDQITTYIQENKLDLADQALTKVEAQKASLPASVQPRVEQLRQRLNEAKKTGGATTRPTTP